MSKLALYRNSLKYITITILLLTSTFGISQISIEIENREIDDVSLISICLESDEIVKYTAAKPVGNKLFIETNGFKNIRISHIGYYDTSFIINSMNSAYSILLRPKVVELTDVVIRKLQSFTNTENRNRKGHNLFFTLEESKIWYFKLGMPELGVKKLDELSIELSNVHKQDMVEVALYESINDVVNSIPIFIDTIILKKVNSNFVQVFGSEQKKLPIVDDFVLGIRGVLINKNRPKNPLSIVTRFQEIQTQLYYQTEKGIIHKIPNEHYLKNFGGYPSLVKSIKYGK